MKIKEIIKEDALNLVAKDESHFFDVKAIAIDGKKVQKIATAFANADGGEFIIGILDSKDEEDDNKRWQGASTIEDFNSHLQSITEIKPTLDFRCTFITCQDFPGITLKINIEKSPDLHQTADGSVYQRFGAQSIKITDPNKITEIKFAKGATSFEDITVQTVGLESISESPVLLSFLDDFSPKSDPLEYILNEYLANPKTYDPHVAGILLFHTNPQAVMPRRCSAKIARYETKEDDIEREYLTNTFTIDGPLYDSILKTISKVTEIMSNTKIWTVDGLMNVNYPPEAIWEIIVNAFIHRDYSISDDVQVLIFDNRIEVISPGKLPGFITIHNILDSRYLRNHKIVRTLNRYKDAPNKDMGEGLNTAFSKMKEWKLKSPEIVEENNYVKVIIPHIPLAKPSELILQFLQKNDEITNRQARDITGIKSENSMKMEFYKLRDEGQIEKVPERGGAASAWRLIK